MLGALQKDGDHYRGASGVQVLHGGVAGVTSAARLTSSRKGRMDSFLSVSACGPRKSPWAGGQQIPTASHLRRWQTERSDHYLYGWRRQPDWRWREGRAPFSLALRLAGHGVSSESVAASQDRKHLQLVQLSAPASHHFRRGVHE